MDIQTTALVKIDIDLAVLEFFKSAVRILYEHITSDTYEDEVDQDRLGSIRDSYLCIIDILELIESNDGSLETLALQQSRRIKDAITEAYSFLESVLNNTSTLNLFTRLKDQIYTHHEAHYHYVFHILKQHPLFVLDEHNGLILNPDSLMILNQNHPIHILIKSIPHLAQLNRQRRRNFVAFENPNHQVIFDITSSEVKLVPKIAFSDFEHDTNRPFVERVLSELLFDFESKKTYYIKLLSKNKIRYGREIKILKGSYSPSKEDVLVLISVLGRLHQENEMGPITVFRKEKLIPTLVANHTTNLNYIETTLHTLNEFRLSLSNHPELLKLPFGRMETIKRAFESEFESQPQFLIALGQNQLPVEKTRISTNRIQGSIESPNYLLAFFIKLTRHSQFESVLPYFDQNESLGSLAKYAKRHRGPIELKDFWVVAKARGILMEVEKEDVIIAVHEIYENARKGTYSQFVSNHLIEQKENLIHELYRLFFILDRHVENEKQSFTDGDTRSEQSEFNDYYVSIASDMHFHNLDHYEKSNFSKHFNIIAGDFADNLFHRGNVELSGKMGIIGVGVLGNHDVFLRTSPSRDLTREIKGHYKNSIQNIKRFFPNIQILNDEILYKDGYAIVGFTLVYDENNGIRTFFSVEDWGRKFTQDDYLQRARNLLDQVPRDMPIIFVSHSPFKEYAVCTNQTLGVPSHYLFKDYPNVKIYIHGHGHSKPLKKKIQEVICMTNPIAFPQSLFELSFSEAQLKKMIKLDRKSIKA